MVQDEQRKLDSELPRKKQQWDTKKTIFNSQLGLDLRKKLIKCYIWGIAVCGAETWTFRKGQKYLETFELWCWRRIQKISWTDRV